MVIFHRQKRFVDLARPLSGRRGRKLRRFGENAVERQAEGQTSAQGAQRGAAPQGRAPRTENPRELKGIPLGILLEASIIMLNL